MPEAPLSVLKLLLQCPQSFQGLDVKIKVQCSISVLVFAPQLAEGQGVFHNRLLFISLHIVW